MKLDAFHKVQLGTVYRGHSKLTDEEVNQLYEGLHITIDDLNNFYGYVCLLVVLNVNKYNLYNIIASMFFKC